MTPFARNLLLAGLAALHMSALAAGSLPWTPGRAMPGNE